MSFQKNLIGSFTHAGAAGVIAGGASYLLLQRRDLVDLFGMELPHALSDGIVVGLSSLGGDAVGVYILPSVEKSLKIQNSTVQTINNVAPPVLTGVITVLINKYALSPRSDSSMKDFILGAGSKLAGDKIMEAWFPQKM